MEEQKLSSIRLLDDKMNEGRVGSVFNKGEAVLVIGRIVIQV
jgi:hypothetical protein